MPLTSACADQFLNGWDGTNGMWYGTNSARLVLRDKQSGAVVEVSDSSLSGALGVSGNLVELWVLGWWDVGNYVGTHTLERVYLNHSSVGPWVWVSLGSAEVNRRMVAVVMRVQIGPVQARPW